MREKGLLVEQVRHKALPADVAETEGVIRTVKKECLWLNEFSSFEEARATIGVCIEEDYNLLYVHSAFGYQCPEEFCQL